MAVVLKPLATFGVPGARSFPAETTNVALLLCPQASSVFCFCELRSIRALARVDHCNTLPQPKGDFMHVLNIVTSPKKDQSASRALVDAFLREYMRQADDIVVDTLDVWQEWLPEFDAETINAKYEGVSGEPMTPLGRKSASSPHASRQRIALSWGCQCGISLSLTSSSN
jgi:Flavodoxin-like fold